MTRYETGTKANYGVYLSTRPLDISFVGSDDEVLEGRPGARYMKLPTWALFILAPALGAGFVMAFPLLVIVGTLGILGSLIVKAFTGKHAYVARSNYQPAAAYFTGKEGEEGAAADPALAALKREVEPLAEAEKKQG